MKNRRKSKISLSLILLYVVFFSFSMMQFSQARYRTSARAEIEATTAKWTFKMNGKENETQEFNINLNECKIEEETSTNGVIAPGSKGKFDIEVDFSQMQTAVKYDIQLEENDNLKFPDNISITNTDNGIVKNLKAQAVSGTFSLEEIKTSPTRTVQIDWEWKIDETQNESQYQGENLQIVIKVVASQIYEGESQQDISESEQ